MDSKEYELRGLILALEERLGKRMDEIEETVNRLAFNRAAAEVRNQGGRKNAVKVVPTGDPKETVLCGQTPRKVTSTGRRWWRTSRLSR